MLLDSIAAGDAARKTARYYEEQADGYTLLLKELRVTFPAGLRNLHQMGASWEPCTDWPEIKQVDKAIVMLFVKP